MPRASSTSCTGPWTARPALAPGRPDAGVVRSASSPTTMLWASWPLDQPPPAVAAGPAGRDGVPARGYFAGRRRELSPARPPPGARLPAPCARRAARRRVRDDGQLQRAGTSGRQPAGGRPSDRRARRTPSRSSSRAIACWQRRLTWWLGGGLHVKRHCSIWSSIRGLNAATLGPCCGGCGSVWAGSPWPSDRLGSSYRGCRPRSSSSSPPPALALSPRFEQWVLTRPGVGPMVRDYPPVSACRARPRWRRSCRSSCSAGWRVAARPLVGAGHRRSGSGWSAWVDRPPCPD